MPRDPLKRPSLKLTCSPYEAEIFDTELGQNSRLLLNFGEVSYNHNGNSTLKGVAHESKLNWKVTALVDELTRYHIGLMHSKSEQARRNEGDPVILLEDTFQEVEEHGDRTRALVPGTTELIVAGGRVYFAQFNVFMTGYIPKFVRTNLYRVEFTLAELDIKAT